MAFRFFDGFFFLASSFRLKIFILLQFSVYLVIEYSFAILVVLGVLTQKHFVSLFFCF